MTLAIIDMFRLCRARTGRVAMIGAALALLTDLGAQSSPQAAVDALLDADRRFAAAAAATDVAGALAPMLADDAIAPLPPGTFVRGKAAIVEALSRVPEHTGARLEWAPVRAGVSADATHGFTVGYMTMQRADGTRVPLKYLSYWIRGPQGWRVAAYRRSRSAEGPFSRTLMPPAVPVRLVPATTDPATTAQHRSSLEAAERAFSDEAQRIGLGAAFAKWGSADAVNMGGPTDPAFVVGAEAIGRQIGAGSPSSSSPVSWASDVAVLVASSGDLGASLGMIRQNAPASGAGPNAVPFITIWRRQTTADAWRYVAE